MRMWNFLGKMLAKIQAKIASCGEPQILAIPHKARTRLVSACSLSPPSPSATFVPSGTNCRTI